jgi:DNA (cytosine-5)-methyltransferase 1
LSDLFSILKHSKPSEEVKLAKYKFIDLFAGIGGFHFALHNLGAECVFASEWDEPARKTYAHNLERVSPKLFKSGNFVGDITKVNKKEIPDFDILTGGFPCQPFSQAGHKKGFEDTRGTLFFDVAEIIKVKKPKAFFLENVRHLHKHDDGKTFDEIKRILTEELGYSFQEFIVKASDHGLPQLRPRLFMIGFKNPKLQINVPEKRELQFTMSDVMGGVVNRDVGFTLRVGGRSSGVADRRNWDGYIVDGVERRLTPDEGKRMQGFPSDFEFPVTNTEAMKQLGNSVAVWAVQDYAKEIIKTLDSSK